ncbi:hypothetical protein ACN9MF_23480 [Methylobacterium fujisawaense]|uniref:hypothetical protein n=1 Tax=Methylobacterium fujisawaense TaxID=107400 RepID=UPI003CE9CBA2
MQAVATTSFGILRSRYSNLAGIEGLEKRCILDQGVFVKVFLGELVSHDPVGTPVSVLFERIRAEWGGSSTAKRRGRPCAVALP